MEGEGNGGDGKGRVRRWRGGGSLDRLVPVSGFNGITVSIMNVFFPAVHARHLKGSRRTNYARAAEFRESAAVYRDKLAEMSKTEVHAGNVTHCKTPSVIRQSVHEMRKGTRLADDINVELARMKLSFEASLGNTIKGFIHGLGTDPFYVIFYMEEQVVRYVEECRGRRCVVHLDSMGSVMKKLPEQKAPYYYAMVLSGSSLPVVEFLTTCHRGTFVMSKLDFFLDHVTHYSGKRWLPQAISCRLFFCSH